MITDKPIQDAKYDPFCEAVYVHDNRFASNGGKPAGPDGRAAGRRPGDPAAGHPLRRRRRSRRSWSNGKLPDDLAIRIRNNGKAGFANFDAPALKASAAPGAADKKPPAPKIVRDLKAYDGELPALAPVSIEGLK